MTFLWVRPKQTLDDEVEMFSLGSMRAEDGVVQADDDSGEVFGERYELIETLACGGTAAVYSARDLHTGALLAVKVLYTGAREKVAAYFWQEGRLAARIKNPHLVHASDFGEDDGRLFIVFDLVPGRSLPELYQEPMPWRELLEVVRQILKALAALHARGVVHRDVKPDNVIVSRNLGEIHVTLLDMGFAAVAPEKRITGSPEPCRRVFGTFGFIAPELLAGIQAEPRCDFYSLGALMYTMLTAQPMPDLSSAPAIIAIPPPSAFIPGLPEAVDDLVMRALSDVEARFQSAREMAEAVRSAQAIGVATPTPAAVVRELVSPPEAELRPFREITAAMQAATPRESAVSMRDEADVAPAALTVSTAVRPWVWRGAAVVLGGVLFGAALVLVPGALSGPAQATPRSLYIDDDPGVRPGHANRILTLRPSSLRLPGAAAPVRDEVLHATQALGVGGSGRPATPRRSTPGAARRKTTFAGSMASLEPRIEDCLTSASLDRRPYTVQVRFAAMTGEIDQVRVAKLDQQHDFTRCVDQVVRRARPAIGESPIESFTFFSANNGR